MKITQEQVANLIPAEKNVRKHPEHQINEMVKSVEKFGQIRPVVIDEENNVLAGNGLVMALKQMGIEVANVLKMKNLSDSDKKKLMVADNRIYALGFDDNNIIMEMIAEMDDFEVPGYDPEMLAEMLGDVDTIDEAIEGFGILNDEESEQFEKHAESKERALERAAFTKTQEQMENEATELHGEPEREMTFSPQKEQPPTAELQRSLDCPHCGEKVWL